MSDPLPAPARRGANRERATRRAWLGAGWMMVAGVAVQSVIPDPYLGVLAGIDWGDKIGHASAYAVLMWWFSQACARHRWRRIALALAALGLGLECLQSVLPYRTPAVLDAASNVLGIVCGWAGARWPGFSIVQLGEGEKKSSRACHDARRE